MDPTARGIDISLPLTPQEGWVLLILLALFAVSLLVYWSRRHMLPSARHEERRTLGALDTFAILLAPVWLLLIALVLYNLWRLTQDFGTDLRPEDLRWHILAFVGLITALGALVSAPLALIRVYTTERQTRVAEQGHVTDQINKAVAGLGAEKEVKRQRTNTAGAPLYEDGPDGKPDFKKPIFEVVTVPNIEVRVGAIYALERIAQDSMKYDKGRDHVQIMEILCAYVRENAPASGSKEFPEPEWEPMKDDATEEERATQETKRRERFGGIAYASKAWAWARTLKAHTDTQAAIQVLGRRTAEQVAHERADRRYGPEGFRLDLRNTNLQAVDASRATLERARLERARLEGANLLGARLEGANLGGARLEGANLRGARFDEATDFRAAVIQYGAVRSCDLSKSNVTQDQVNAMFGDGSVTLPEGLERPAHWPGEDLNVSAFFAEWRKRRADPASYVPPAPEPQTAPPAPEEP